MYSEIVNKIRYDNPGKLMKQTSFTVKRIGEGGGEPSQKAIYYNKEKF